MALSDYRLCDICERKAFYDSKLNYQYGKCKGNYRIPEEYDIPFNEVGEPQIDDPESVEEHGLRLDYLGDWAVLCQECAKTHKCVIVPREE